MHNCYHVQVQLKTSGTVFCTLLLPAAWRIAIIIVIINTVIITSIIIIIIIIIVIISIFIIIIIIIVIVVGLNYCWFACLIDS